MIAAEFKGRDFDDVKKRFGLDEVTFSPEDEEQIKKDFPWLITETEEKV